MFWARRSFSIDSHSPNTRAWHDLMKQASQSRIAGNLLSQDFCWKCWSKLTKTTSPETATHARIDHGVVGKYNNSWSHPSVRNTYTHCPGAQFFTWWIADLLALVIAWWLACFIACWRAPFDFISLATWGDAENHHGGRRVFGTTASVLLWSSYTEAHGDLNKCQLDEDSLSLMLGTA